MEFFGLIAFCLVIMHFSLPDKLKALSRRIKKLEKANQKGKTAMSQMIQELVGSTCQIYFDESIQSIYSYEILTADEEWVKIRSELNNGKEEIRIVRIDSIKELRPVN